MMRGWKRVCRVVLVVMNMMLLHGMNSPYHQVGTIVSEPDPNHNVSLWEEYYLHGDYSKHEELEFATKNSHRRLIRRSRQFRSPKSKRCDQLVGLQSALSEVNINSAELFEEVRHNTSPSNSPQTSLPVSDTKKDAGSGGGLSISPRYLWRKMMKRFSSSEMNREEFLKISHDDIVHRLIIDHERIFDDYSSGPVIALDASNVDDRCAVVWKEGIVRLWSYAETSELRLPLPLHACSLHLHKNICDIAVVVDRASLTALDRYRFEDQALRILSQQEFVVRWGAGAFNKIICAERKIPNNVVVLCLSREFGSGLYTDMVSYTADAGMPWFERIAGAVQAAIDSSGNWLAYAMGPQSIYTNGTLSSFDHATLMKPLAAYALRLFIVNLITGVSEEISPLCAEYGLCSALCVNVVENSATVFAGFDSGSILKIMAGDQYGMDEIISLDKELGKIFSIIPVADDSVYLVCISERGLYLIDLTLKTSIELIHHDPAMRVTVAHGYARDKIISVVYGTIQGEVYKINMHNIHRFSIADLISLSSHHG